MGEFTAEITERLRGAEEALRLAEETQDDLGVHTHEGELADLRRLAVEHGIAVPEPAVALPPTRVTTLEVG